MRGYGGDDLISSFGGSNDDFIGAVDSDNDVDCGGGYDFVRADRGDDLSNDCERVRRVS